jgi:hypothetical protein
MKRQFIFSNIFFYTVITLLLTLTFSLSVPAQKIIRGNLPNFAEDTSTYPHDFNDDYYAQNGVVTKAIIGRRTGSDFLSVFGLSSDPRHSSVRVLATLPAYGQNGEVLFWTPLGELLNDGFTGDITGIEARETASSYPVFVFPKTADPSLFSFTNVRQAALLGEPQNTFAPYPSQSNPLGLRLIVFVNYTEKAFNTKEGYMMMLYMGKKNGYAADGTPLIKYKSDIDELAAHELLAMQKGGLWDDPSRGGTYAISPLIIEPTKQAIARDAFLLMASQNGEPLLSESIFTQQFGCLQKTGEWCSE